MLRVLATIFVLLIFCSPAQSQSPTTYPEPLESAIRDAERSAINAPRFSFTREFTFPGQSIRIRARFNPHAAAGQRWTLLEPAGGNLDQRTRDVWESLRTEDNADLELILDEPRDIVAANATPSEGANGTVTFDGALAPSAVIDFEDPRGVGRRALRASMTVSRATSELRAARVYAVSHFSSQRGVRVDAYDQRMVFTRAWPSGPVVTQRLDVTLRGNAYLVGFDESGTITHSEFAPVSAP